MTASPLRIALIGDSQAEALWPRVRQALPDAVFPLVRFQRGWAENHYNKEGRIGIELKASLPNLVVVELGGNNSTLNEAKYRTELNMLLAAVRGAKPQHILYLGPAAATKQPYKTNKEWTRSAQHAFFAGQPDVLWMDSFPYTQTGQVDGVHFSSTTYGPWAAAIVESIKRVAAAPPTSPVLSSPSADHRLPLALGMCTAVLGAALLLMRYLAGKKESAP